MSNNNDNNGMSFAHIERDELEKMLIRATRYIDDARNVIYRMAPDCIWSGRPLAEAIEDIIGTRDA